MIKTPALPDFSLSFHKKFISMVGLPEIENSSGRQGRPPKLSALDIVAALTWHAMQKNGTFAYNQATITGQVLSDSALSERRQALGTEPWLTALSTSLKPVANPTEHPHAFYKEMRLVGVDGTTFNVANTPPMKRISEKTKTRRGSAAFFRIGCVALVELGTHAPLAVRVAEDDESEAALAAKAILDLAEQDLLIADRYYGSGKWAARFLSLSEKPRFLIRVQERFGARIVRRLGDGSAIVKVKDPDSGGLLTLRECKARVRRPGRAWVNVRFWTNLLDHRLYPAKELIELYSMRWEQEIAFRELKKYLQEDNLLLSHTKVTAIQEICALFMAQAIVAKNRLCIADNQGGDVMQISFEKTLELCRHFGWLLRVAGDFITPTLLQEIISKTQKELMLQSSKKRRHRSCRREVRQPIKNWPRLMETNYDKGEFQYEVRNS